MARRHLSFVVPESREAAFGRLEDTAGKFDWLVTKLTPPGRFHRLTPEINLKAGPGQPEGCGKTRIRFYRVDAQHTRIRIFTRRALTEARAELPAISLLRGLGVNPEDHNLDSETSPLPGRNERKLIRIAVGAILVATIIAVILVPVPTDAKGHPDPPAIALNDERLFYVEVALLAFYGGLLLLTPAFAGIFRGRLPSEISAKGAKYDVAQERAETADSVVDAHGTEIAGLNAQLKAALGNIEKLASATKTDLKMPPKARAKS